MRRLGPRLIFTVLIVVSSGGRALADNGWEGQILSLTEDNDVTAGTDRHYTQGARISYYSRDEALPSWLRSFSSHLPAIGLEVQARKFGLAIGQETYTPEKLEVASVITNDRPYAGWLFGSLSLQKRGEVSPAWLAMEHLRLDLGVIGPESLAQAAQEASHSTKPQGWKNQLKTEPAFALRYERRYRYGLRDKQERWGADLIPSFRGSAGTLDTSLGLGATLRFGYHVPNEFEAPKQSTPLRYGTYLFTGAEGRYVIRNLFLDGNTFVSSPHIEKEPLVADLRIGLSFVLKNVEIVAAHTLRTREFTGQRADDSYGTIAIIVKF